MHKAQLQRGLYDVTFGLRNVKFIYSHTVLY